MGSRAENTVNGGGAIDAIEAPSTSRARRWLINYPRAVPLAIFIAIAAVTILSVFVIESNARAREDAQMREYAQSIAAALERRGNNFASYLRAGAALFSTTENVEPETFRQFVSELRLDLEYRGAEGIGWITVLPASEKDAFIERERAVQPEFPDIRPPIGANTQTIAPVTYFYPDIQRNRRALGFDMYSEPARAAAMAEAKRIVSPTASARIVLAQEGAGNAPGFIIFMPAYRRVDGGRPVDRALAGFVYSPFGADEFLQSALDSTAPSSLGVRLYDGTTQTNNLLFSHSLADGGGARVQEPVKIANRQFELVIEAPKGSSLAPLSMVTLLFGLATASLLMLLSRLLTQQAFEDQSKLAFYEQQHSIRNSLTRELNHRVKNTLANVLSIMSLTKRRAKSLDEFADSLEGRIRSLSATHDLLTGTDWGTTPIRSVLEAELQHFRAASDHIIKIDGPPVELAPNDALSFGLAIHELATNAAKFGAFSVPDGKVSVYWRLVEDHLAEVEWHESDGPLVDGERSRGFGTELIEKIVAHELRNPVRLAFEREGVRCTMRVPVRVRSDFQIRQADAT
ncbi:MAG: CHASE domain-containing protein [Erythrobacter sp.]